MRARHAGWLRMCGVLCLLAGRVPALAGEEPAMIRSVFARDMELRDFAELMTRGCGSDWKVLVSEAAGGKKISFYLSNTGVEETLRSICATHGLWYRRSPRSDIVQIVTMEEYRQGLNLYADEAVEVVPVLYPSPEEIGDTLARLFQDRVVWDPPPENLADDLPRIESALDRMDTIADRATLVDAGSLDSSSSSSRDRYVSSRDSRQYGDTRSDSRWRESRYGTGGGSRGTEEQTLADVVEQQRRALEAQQAVRMPDDIAGRSDRPGLVYVSASPSANALVLRSSDAASVETIKNVIRQLDKPRPQVLLEVKVFDIQLDDDEARGVDWLFQNGPGSDGIMFSGGRSTGVTAEPGSVIRSSNPLSLIPQGTGLDPLATVFSIVSADVRARIQLLQDERRIRALATPSLLVADSEASRIFIGSEVTVLEKVEPETEYYGENNQNSRTTYTVTAPRKRIGTTLLITPKIHADRTVTIRLLQEETELGSGRTVQYGQTASDQFTSQDVKERSVITTVLARDGSAIAIGGLIRRWEDTRDTGVPLLMNIPVLGNLFRRTLRFDGRSELLVLIQPRVLLAPGEDRVTAEEWLDRMSPEAAGLLQEWVRPAEAPGTGGDDWTIPVAY
jgi:general secretion pathway protein D